MASSKTHKFNTSVVTSTVIADHDFEDSIMDNDEESLNVAADQDVEESVFETHLAAATKTTKDLLHAKNTTRNYEIYLRGGRKYCESIGKPGALDIITKETPLVLKAYIASKCEWIEQEEREVDQEAEREAGLLDVGDLDDTNKIKNKNKNKNKKEDSQPKSLSTAESIRAAWKLFYRRTFKVQDGWRIEESGKCIGNPVDDIDLTQYIQTLRKQHNRERITRHSIAITLQSMEKLMAYLDRPDVREKHGAAKQLGHPLRNEDYVFPTLGARGDVRLHQKVSPDTIQRFLDLFTNEAGLIKDTSRSRYTTHCFRRGGAQHCFMFKKPQWSLKACKWWGGWSKGAERGAIENYLMDEISAYEESFEDQYSEDRAAYKHTNFMGEADNDGSSSAGMVRLLQEQISQLQQQLQQQLQHQLQQYQTQSNNALLQISQQLQALSAPGVRHQQPQQQQQSTISHTQSDGIGQQGEQLQHQHQPQQQPQQPQQQQQQREQTVQPRQLIPVAKTVQEVDKQWRFGMPSHGLLTPLKDWTPNMRSGPISALYSQRKTVAKEYELHNYNMTFLTNTHGDSVYSLGELRKSIKRKREEQQDQEKEDSPADEGEDD
ncbi:hypothetical protein BGZ83_006395 [Gryganskiella cystojenkinii]|nr:hypothetical protein BGZ83_006395 [Gryganskiella cystojenkinii]